ncbi:MAG: hypothetical protein OEM02_00955 [Desulfobulbaceae bacterium]|nr:hypothetical protein [Desulfobulbaceae bacterium]
MTFIALTITGLLLLILQTTILTPNPLWYGSPDLLFILTAYLGYRANSLHGILILIPLSWFNDVFSGTVLGTYPLIYLSSFFLFKYVSEHMPVRKSLYQLPLIGAIYLIVYRLAHFWLGIILPNPLPPWSWPIILLKTVIMVILAIPLLRFFETIARRCEKLTNHSGNMLHIRSGNRFH